MVHTQYELAKLFYRMHESDPTVVNFLDFTNWGPWAGASLQHPHSQRSVQTFTDAPVHLAEAERSRRYFLDTGRNMFDDIIKHEIEDGRRVIFENGDVVILSEFCPKFEGQFVVIPRADFSHVLQMDHDARERVIVPALGAINATYFYRGQPNLNTAWHHAPFGEMDGSRRYYRTHMHVYPRPSKDVSHGRGSGSLVKDAGAEVGFGIDVLGEFPETSTRQLRRWYEGDHPSRDRVFDSGGSDDRLKREFDEFLARR
ncbi:hypothetical protein ACFLQN_00315 [Candidatus Aenigmatarchaeota archaeon]